MKNITLSLDTWLDIIEILKTEGNGDLLTRLILKFLNKIGCSNGVKSWSNTLVNITFTKDQYSTIIQAMPSPKMQTTPIQLKLFEIKKRRSK